MREKLANELENTWFEIEHMEDLWLQMADVPIKIICEEIEKGLLTDEEMDIEARARARNSWLEYGKDIAKAQLQKILALLK